MKNHNLKLKIILKFANFTFLLVILTFAFSVLNSRFAAAQNVRYPIRQLGNCRDAKECYLYCQIPKNTPACWSYNKYIMNRDVLGETVSPEDEAKRLGITFPIAELGNCGSPSECFIYCNQPQNQRTCFSWAKSKGLVKENPKVRPDIMEAARRELGCKSDIDCMVSCQQPQNVTKCQAFAQKYQLVDQPPPSYQGHPAEIMGQAKAEFGCDSEASCMEFCNQPGNMPKCMEFAKRHGMMGHEEYDRHKDYMGKKMQMMEDAKRDLGCGSYESCASICANPNNQEKCMVLARKYGMGGATSTGQYIQYDATGKNVLPCNSPSECQELCSKNISICTGGITPQSVPPQYQQYQGDYMKYEEGKMRQMMEYRGDFLGPSGCKTEAECRAYCENHPSECPGFSQRPPEYITPPTGYTPHYTPPPYPTYQPYQPREQYDQVTSYPTYYPQPTYTQTYPTISPAQ